MIKSFEGGRGIAAILVALFHFRIGPASTRLLPDAYLFVDMFFVLSGFVIYASYASRLESMRDLRAFLIRRFGRLFPLLIFSTVAFVLANNFIVLAKRAAISVGFTSILSNLTVYDFQLPSLREIVSTATLTHGLGLFDRLILNYASWSISTEFYTYVLFAVACILLRGQARLLCLAALALSGYLFAVWGSLQFHDCLQKGNCYDVTFDFGFARCVCSFALGALLYSFSRRHRFNAAHLQLSGMLALLVLFSLSGIFPALAFASPLIFGALVLSVSRDTGPLSWLLNTRLCQLLGTRSYSIYMMHPVLVIAFTPIAKRATGIAFSASVILAYLAALFVVSGWTYKHIEDPFRTLFNRIAAGYTKTLSRVP